MRSLYEGEKHDRNAKHYRSRRQWCPDCRRSKQLLGEHKILYHWVDIEQDKAGEGYVLQKNNGKRIIPIMKLADGSILVKPSNAELAAKLGLKTTGQRSPYDFIPWHRPPGHMIIGGALYRAEGIDTLEGRT